MRWRRPASSTDVGHIDNKILEAFAERLTHPFAVDLETEDPDQIAVFVQIEPGLLQVIAARKRVTSTTTWLLLAWMVGSSVVLSAISIFFLRLQIRPIRQLAKAADSFGKGRDVGDFRPRGALGDPAGGARLQPDAPPHPAPHQPAHRDAGRGQPRPAHAADPHAARARAAGRRRRTRCWPGCARTWARCPSWSRNIWASPAARAARASSPPSSGRCWRACASGPSAAASTLEIAMERPIMLPLRPTAFHRCLGNLVDNACRYARWIGISVKQKDEMVEIAIDDDGPGHPRGAAREGVRAVRPPGRAARGRHRRHRARA